MPFGAPRQLAEVMALGIVPNNTEVPRPVLRLIEAEPRRRSPRSVDFKTLWEVQVAVQFWCIAIFLDPCDGLHATCSRFRQYLGEDVPPRCSWDASDRAQASCQSSARGVQSHSCRLLNRCHALAYHGPAISGLAVDGHRSCGSTLESRGRGRLLWCAPRKSQVPALSHPRMRQRRPRWQRPM